MLNVVDIQGYVLRLPKDLERYTAFCKSFFDACKYARDNGLDAREYIVKPVDGIDSERLPRSPKWRQGESPLDRRGHTACYWGHETIWRLALANAPLDNGLYQDACALIFEDDARLDKDFYLRLRDAYKELPNDWDILYLGGQHWTAGRPAPTAYSDNLYKIANVNRLHGYMLRLRAIPSILLHFSENTDWGHRFTNTKSGQAEAEVDYELGYLTETGALNGFALRNPNGKRDWAVYQGASFSWTQGRMESDRRWELR